VNELIAFYPTFDDAQFHSTFDHIKPQLLIA